jgi:large subunit ribosomal protein L28
MRKHMARVCEITGKTSRVGGRYSNRIRATKFNPTGKTRRQVNFQKKTIFVPEIGKKVTVRVSTKGLKTMKKRGAFVTLQKAGLI